MDHVLYILPCLLVESDGVVATSPRGKKTPVPALEPGPFRNRTRIPAPPCCGPGRDGRALRPFPFLASYVCALRVLGFRFGDTTTCSGFTPDIYYK